MNLSDSLVLATVDKLLIGFLIIIAGYWLNKRLERLKGALALENAMSPPRTPNFGI